MHENISDKHHNSKKISEFMSNIFILQILLILSAKHKIDRYSSLFRQPLQRVDALQPADPFGHLVSLGGELVHHHPVGPAHVFAGADDPRIGEIACAIQHPPPGRQLELPSLLLFEQLRVHHRPLALVDRPGPVQKAPVAPKTLLVVQYPELARAEIQEHSLPVPIPVNRLQKDHLSYVR